MPFTLCCIPYTSQADGIRFTDITAGLGIEFHHANGESGQKYFIEPIGSGVVYRNNRDGTFTDITVEAGISWANGKGLGVVCGDIDNDGDVDIIVSNLKEAPMVLQC